MCYPHFTGPLCDQIACAPNTCLNGGTCHTTGQGHACDCPPQFTGQDCQTNNAACLPAPCLNGGSCVPAPAINSSLGFDVDLFEDDDNLHLKVHAGDVLYGGYSVRGSLFNSSAIVSNALMTFKWSCSKTGDPTVPSGVWVITLTGETFEIQDVHQWLPDNQCDRKVFQGMFVIPKLLTTLCSSNGGVAHINSNTGGVNFTANLQVPVPGSDVDIRFHFCHTYPCDATCGAWSSPATFTNPVPFECVCPIGFDGPSCDSVTVGAPAPGGIGTGVVVGISLSGCAAVMVTVAVTVIRRRRRAAATSTIPPA